jgi:hypothetical protein
MNYAYALTRRLLTLATLLAASCPIIARPLLVAPKQRLAIPQLIQGSNPGDYPTYYHAAVVDGDSLLVSASRVVDTDGNRSEGTYLFQRGANGRWAYVKPLVEGPMGNPLINGNLATVQVSTQVLVFELGSSGWTQTATFTPTQPNSYAFRIDDGAIYLEPRSTNSSQCAPSVQQWRKVGSLWQVIATIGPQHCGTDQSVVDVNDGRAVRFLPVVGTQQPAPEIYAQSTPAWSLVGHWPPSPPIPGYVSSYGYYGSLSGNLGYADPGFLFRDSGGNNWASAGRLYEPESELSLDTFGGKLRGNSLFVFGQEQDYEIPSHDEDFPSEWTTVRLYRPRADGFFDYFAKLSTDYDVWSWNASEDGTRVAAISPRDNYGLEEPTLLYVFEIPATATFPGTQQDNFESGNYSKWTATVGQFAVAQTNVTRVLRQSSVAGDAKTYLTAIDWTDQSIEADIRPTAFNGTDRWFGLAARRTDDQNYYYVTFRQPSTVSIRRMRNGAVTELARDFTREPFVPGQSYRVRLEAVGDQLAAFVNGFPVTHAKDSAFTHGHPGLVSYRASFDADDVIVSSGTRLLYRFDTYRRLWSPGWNSLSQGTWQFVIEPSDDVDEHGDTRSTVLRQSDTSGDVKWFSKNPIGNQVVSARVRPMGYGTTTGTNDAWLGLAAHAVDAQNYYYVSLRRRNELSLRRMVNGQVQVIATVPQAVTLNTWYDLRLEIIGVDIRAYVNGDLKISAKDPTMTGGGRTAMLMYKTAADWYHYIAYQP